MNVDKIDAENFSRRLIVLCPLKNLRANWETAFKKMAAMQDDGLLISSNLKNHWDNDEWKW